jgi:hypothetical protein
MGIGGKHALKEKALRHNTISRRNYSPGYPDILGLILLDRGFT